MALKVKEKVNKIKDWDLNIYMYTFFILTLN